MTKLHTLYENVRALYDAGEFTQVQNVIQAAISSQQIDPRLPLARDTLFLLGASKARMGDLDGAEGWFRQILRFNPRHFKAAYLLGVALERKGRLAEALKFYSHANLLDPSSKAVSQRLEALRRHPESHSFIAASPTKDEGEGEGEPQASSSTEDDTGNQHIRAQPVRAAGDPGNFLFAANRRLSSYFFEWLTVGALVIAGPLLAAGSNSTWPLAACAAGALSIVAYIFFNRLQKSYVGHESKTDRYWGIIRKLIRTVWLTEVAGVTIDRPWGYLFTNTARILFWADEKHTKVLLALEAIDTYEEMLKLFNRYKCQLERDQGIDDRSLAMPGGRTNLPIVGRPSAEPLVNPTSMDANADIKRLPAPTAEKCSPNADITGQCVRIIGDPGAFLYQRRRRLSSYPFQWLTAGAMLCTDVVMISISGGLWPVGHLSMSALLTGALIFLHRRTRSYTGRESRLDQDRGIVRPKIETVFLMNVAALDFDQPWGFWSTGTARILLWADKERKQRIMAIEAIGDHEWMEELYHRMQNQRQRDEFIKRHGLLRPGDTHRR